MSNSQSRLARRAQLLMVSGFICSYIGSQLIEGAVSGFIALGIFPLVWIPIYRTMTDFQDALASGVSRLVEGRNPGRVLVACESIDVVCTVAAIVALLVVPQQAHPIVLAVYLLVVSILPLIIDLAEEFYLNDLGQVDATLVVRANVILAVASGLSGLILGQPVGALISPSGMIVILGLNAVFSFVAILLRSRSAAVFTPPHDIEEEDEPAEAMALSPQSILRFFIPGRLRYVARFGYMSPLFSFFVSFSPALLGTYVFLWAAGDGPNATANLGLILLIFGVLVTVTPYVVGRIMEKFSTSVHTLLQVLLWGVPVGYSVALVGLLITESAGVTTALVVGGVIASSTCVMAVRFTISAARQTTLTQADFRMVLGWSYSLTSIGGIAGTWMGLWVGSARNPTVAVTIAAVVTVCLAVFATVTFKAGVNGSSHKAVSEA